MREENSMPDKKPEPGAIQLDNQSIQVRILMPSGRFQVTDKVAGVVWTMKTGRGCGFVTLQSEGKERDYKMGVSGSKGILFTQNFYMTRSAASDDFHDVSLSGVLGDDPETTVTVRYLLSSSFPILHCFCYISGKQEERISRIQFPLGWRLSAKKGNGIWLPRGIQWVESPDSRDEPDLWSPSLDEDHRVVGAPYFAITQEGMYNRMGGCIGCLQHPLCRLEIAGSGGGRCAQPSSSRLDVTGKSEKNPYYFRYQFVPSSDLEALSWLYRDYLSEPEQSAFFETVSLDPQGEK